MNDFDFSLDAQEVIDLIRSSRYADKLTKWELDFLDNIEQRYCQTDKQLSETQASKLKQIYLDRT